MQTAKYELISTEQQHRLEGGHVLHDYQCYTINMAA
jgi:hypothetical protein